MHPFYERQLMEVQMKLPCSLLTVDAQLFGMKREWVAEFSKVSNEMTRNDEITADEHMQSILDKMDVPPLKWMIKHPKVTDPMANLKRILRLRGA